MIVTIPSRISTTFNIVHVSNIFRLKAVKQFIFTVPSVYSIISWHCCPAIVQLYLDINACKPAKGRKNFALSGSVFCNVANKRKLLKSRN